MTMRSRMLAILGLAGLVFGVIRQQPAVSLLCLSLMIWMFWEWSSFIVSARRELSRLKIRRTLNGRDDPRGVIWAGRRINIELHLSCQPFSFKHSRCFRDVVPEILNVEPHKHTPAKAPSKKAGMWLQLLGQRISEAMEESHWREAENQHSTLWSESSVTIAYQATVRAAGEVTLPGVRIEFRDPMRLFRMDRFVPHEQTYRVLPRFAAAADATPIIKRLNSIPRQGIHRQQRAGVGFELLELREYLDGDPPKAIAWKASARRDKLMTRQYESEVPLRVQLIVDGTASTRVGGFGLRLIDQITHAAGSIAHSVTTVGDAIGAYLVDDSHTERVSASTGTIGFYRMMQQLSEFSKNRNPPSRHLTASLLETAYSVVSERYPELLDPHINPLGLHWLRMLPRRSERQRVQLANAIASLQGLSLYQHAALISDDALLAQQLAAFLTDCGMPWVPPMVDPEDAHALRDSQRLPRLAKSVLTAIANAHDNEVLVIIAELLGEAASSRVPAASTSSVSTNFSKNFDELIHVIGMAKAKHHRVAVLLPSPTFIRPTPHWTDVAQQVHELRLAAEHIRLRELATPIQKRLSKLGVPATMSGEPRAMHLVLSELEIARTGRLTPSGRGR
jgi:hypothetical protein